MLWNVPVGLLETRLKTLLCIISSSITLKTWTLNRETKRRKAKTVKERPLWLKMKDRDRWRGIESNTLSYKVIEFGNSIWSRVKLCGFLGRELALIQCVTWTLVSRFWALSWFWSFSGCYVYMEHEKPGYSHPCIHDHNSIQVSDHLCTGVSWFLHRVQYQQQMLRKYSR